jgi:hypothetical protein
MGRIYCSHGSGPSLQRRLPEYEAIGSLRTQEWKVLPEAVAIFVWARLESGTQVLPVMDTWHANSKVEGLSGQLTSFATGQ